MTPRKWVAWKLVSLAARIHDTTFYDRVYITSAEGETTHEVFIIGDAYGSGFMSGNFGPLITEGSKLHIEHDFVPDWH